LIELTRLEIKYEEAHCYCNVLLSIIMSTLISTASLLTGRMVTTHDLSLGNVASVFEPALVISAVVVLVPTQESRNSLEVVIKRLQDRYLPKQTTEEKKTDT
jgi:hypothetical protein